MFTFESNNGLLNNTLQPFFASENIGSVSSFNNEMDVDFTETSNIKVNTLPTRSNDFVGSSNRKRKRKLNENGNINNVIKSNNKKRVKTSYFGSAANSNIGNKTKSGDKPVNEDKIIFLINNKPLHNSKSNRHVIFEDDDVDPSPKRPKIDQNDLPLILPKKNDPPIQNGQLTIFTLDDFFNELFKELLNNDNSMGPPKPNTCTPPNLIAPAKKKPEPSQPVAPKPIQCNNPLCNHKTLEEDPTPPTVVSLEEIKSVDDLIELGKVYHCKKQTSYKGLNLRLMNNLVPPLVELNDMIGMNDVKTHVVDQILFFLQGFNTSTKCGKCQDCVYNLPCVQSNTEMLHTVITGPPGVGKTCLGRIMGSVYKAMGILSKGTFHEVSRTDFVAGYLGQTALKTQKLIDDCQGSVMFIDEVYSLGSKEKRDSFSKEAIDTLNKNLSDKRDFLCIIAGYEKDIEECFFSINSGLKRRFPFRYNVKEYDYNELVKIFKLKVEKEGWTLDFNSELSDDNVKYTDDDLVNLFRTHQDSFPYSGGDIETYFLQCKIVHGRRIPTIRKCLSFGDLEN